MSLMDTTCLCFSTVKNTSGQAKIFGFLPSHGKKLAINEEFVVFGDICDAIAAGQRGGRAESRRDILAFQAAIRRGDMQIINTPAVILEDIHTGEVQMLVLHSGTLGVTEPCWASESGEFDSDPFD